MINCPACRTMNADRELVCLSCGVNLPTGGAASCPEGHPMDPTWAVCPYCAALGIPSPVSAAAPDRPPPRRPSAGATRLEVLAPPASAAANPPGELIAALVAPRLGPGGTLFPLRQGKSYLGAAPHQDIRLADDPRVSAEHALLLARGGRVFLTDRHSTNGTWVDGQEVDVGGSVELADRSLLRFGDTEIWLLMVPGRCDEEA